MYLRRRDRRLGSHPRFDGEFRENWPARRKAPARRRKDEESFRRDRDDFMSEEIADGTSGRTDAKKP